MKVLNSRDKAVNANAVYVGRGTPWGNPFPINKQNDRARVIELFIIYAEERIKVEPEWLAPLKDKDLVCWCAPLACHAEWLLAKANS